MSRNPRAVQVGTENAQEYAASIDKNFWEFLESVPDAMMLSDSGGRIIWANTKTEQMFGYRRDELISKKVEFLIPDRFRTLHREDRAIYYANPNIRPMGVGRDVWARRKDGVEFRVEINLSPVEIGGKALVWSAIRNTSDRERSIAQLRAGMEERRLALAGLISICAWCKRIRNEGGSWQQLENYIESHSEASFTHGICQDCLKKLDPAQHNSTHHPCVVEDGEPM
jgi:PAS domain S-box-containing protein